MRLTAYTDYALRVLILAGLQEGGLVRVAEIAERFAISRNHLTKVVHNLGRHGFVETVQGRHGGLRLARPPGAIRVGDVVRRFEENTELVPCFGTAPDGCRIRGACRLTGAFGEALDAFFAVLDRVTLADLLATRGELVAALSPERLRDAPAALRRPARRQRRRTPGGFTNGPAPAEEER